MKKLPEKPQSYVDAHALNWEYMEEKYGATCTEDTLSVDVCDLDGKFLFKKTRNLNANKENGEPKYKNESGSHATLFNYHNVKDAQTIVICEGEMDCICLNQNGIPAVTSTSGAGKFDPAWAKLLAGKKIYICLDNDEAGKKGTRNLIKLFPDAKIIEITDGKDVCEFFANSHTREDFVMITRISQTAQEWENANIPEDFTVLDGSEVLALDLKVEPWLIEDILYSQGFCFIYGAEGTGKSLLALSIAEALTTGKDWLGKFKTTGTYNVLILDKENPLSMVQKRMQGMDFKSDNKRIHFLKYPEKFRLSDGKGGYSEFAKTLARIIADKKINCIIFDSFVDFMEGNESSAVDTQDFFNSVRELFPLIAYIGLHHENKPSQGVFRNDSQRLRGSSNINAQLFTAFRLEPVAKSKTEITLKQVKARDSQKLDKFMIRMIIKVLPDGKTIPGGFEYCGLVEESVDESKVGEIEAIISEMLTSSAYISRKQVEEIGEGKGVSTSTIRRTLKKMMDDGTINEVKKGKEKWYTRGLMAFEEEEGENGINDPNEIFDGSVPGLD